MPLVYFGYSAHIISPQQRIASCSVNGLGRPLHIFLTTMYNSLWQMCGASSLGIQAIGKVHCMPFFTALNNYFSDIVWIKLNISFHQSFFQIAICPL